MQNKAGAIEPGKSNQIRDILDTLVILGQARKIEEGYVS